MRNISIHDTYSTMSSAKEKALPASRALFFFIESSIVRLLDRFLPVFGTVDTGEGWYSQLCPRVIGGITTCHKMRHSSMPWQDQITHPCFLARERNKLTQKMEHAARAHNHACHRMDKPVTPSSDDMAVIESFVISL